MPLLPLDDPFWIWTVLRCYVVLHLLAFACWPWFTRLFSWKADRGAGLAMAGGILIYTLASQLLWRTGFFELRFVWSLLLTLSLGISARYFIFKPCTCSVGTRVRMRRSFIQGWFVFSVLFWLWAFVRSANPGMNHTEQPMNVMWMGAALASGQPPLQDAWFGGEPASYYATGQQVVAFLGLTLGLPLQISVNITQIIWFALTGLLAFETGKSLVRPGSTTGNTGAGILAVLFISFCSTPKGFLDALTNTTWWWWWDASRVIADGDSNLITEFPFFSFWLGDHHAHVIGLPFLLLSVLGGIGLLRSRSLTCPTLLLPLLCVSWSWQINPWQTPTALGLLGAGLLFRNRKLRLRDLKPFVPALVVALILLYPARAPGPVLALEWNTANKTGFFEFLKVFGFLLPGVVWLTLTRPHRFGLALMVLGTGMFLCANVVYLQDAFQNRMNTVFKVYYQMWIVLGLLSAVGFAQALNTKRSMRVVAGLSLCLCLLPGLMYAGRLSLGSRTSSRRSMNAWESLPENTQHLLRVSERLIVAGERIVEAPGISYESSTSLLGTWSRGNSIIGWTGHQAQWRPGQGFPSLEGVYEAASQEDLQAALVELEADWVLVGSNEKNLFNLNSDFDRWMEDVAYPVVDQEQQKLYRLR